MPVLWSGVVVKRRDLEIDVVTAARQRLINVFSHGVRIYMSVSGGKDSIVLADLTLNLIREGRIDPKQLTVLFIDEEAMYDSAIESTMNLRKRFIAAGVEFRWYCLEVIHFNCFNQLTEAETYVCWDSTIPERWVRPMPSFAITDHPRLKRREENYQSFLPKVTRDGIQVAGIRVAESLQRLSKFNQKWDGSGGLFWPIFDWKDTDVWRYIRDHDLPFPESYLHLYQTGRSRREMRISQFFSIDTAKSLVRMAEHEPDLMERIMRREPNAYLAALYWDTEMFRKAGGSGQQRSDDSDERVDYKAEVLDILRRPPKNEKKFIEHHRRIRRYLIRFPNWEEKHWKQAYQIFTAGDPKNRMERALVSGLRLSQSQMELMKQ